MRYKHSISLYCVSSHAEDILQKSKLRDYFIQTLRDGILQFLPTIDLEKFVTSFEQQHSFPRIANKEDYEGPCGVSSKAT